MRISSPTTRKSLAALAACVLAGGCLGDTGTTITGPDFSAYAQVEGTVFALSGDAVSYAIVGVHIPSDRSPQAYYAPDVQTDISGQYQLALIRTGTAEIFDQTDTLSVWVVAVQPVGPSAGRRDSSKIRLDFHLPSEQSDPQHLDLTLAVP
jgi:hypothetical protein